ncbi:hypothetical protein Hanom_Chr09g00788731 [Helianthus anomalus]
MPKERKFIRPLQYFTHNFFEFLSDIKTLPWWDVEELVQRNNIKQFYYGLDVKQHDQHMWDYISCKKMRDFQIGSRSFQNIFFTILESGAKDITLDIKPLRCLKNMLLRAMEQDFYADFQGWMYNQSTAEVVISLYDKSTGKSRRISVLDPMWLVNCSKKGIDCLFYNKIVYKKPDKVQAMQYQKLV